MKSNLLGLLMSVFGLLMFSFGPCSDYPDGYYPAGENCESFYGCQNGEHTGQFDCGGDLVFNFETQTCDWAWNVEGCTGTAHGSGFGWDDREQMCPTDQWALVSTSTVSGEGSSASVYVEQGAVIPGTNVIAGTSGYYSSSSAHAYSNLRETYKQYCISAAWHYYCSGAKSCRVKF